MIARHSGKAHWAGAAWRCYSPSTLERDEYARGSCYCTQDLEIKHVIGECETSKPINVFQKAEGYCFRIPAIVKTAKGALVAFSEARKGGCGDSSVDGIVVKRSTNEGKSWSSLSFAASGRCGNPYPIALSSGRIALIYAKNPNGVTATGTSIGIRFSDDDGVSFGDEIDVGEGFGAAKTSLPGPGAGIELRDFKTKRLMVVSHHGMYRRDYISYSDDGGYNWKTVDDSHEHFLYMDEATLADLGGGNVIVNMRHLSEQSRGRRVSKSTDGGLTWTGTHFDGALKGPVCEASLAAFDVKGQQRLYFANPASTTSRSHLTVRMSLDGGSTWPGSVEVQQQSSEGYSSLVQGTIDAGETKGGILYASSAGAGYIDFATFDLNILEAIVEDTTNIEENVSVALVV
eukprot:TRINITY_DN4681_c0_g3_i1.p1 TRINITY_DN4681_c0_g3~~TRINITY_DN4681_c0_g3_i1.p1  ORF type:complete len:464 (+),score=53.37 TRINITY_DN4681_c0_g3_i1:188-1393(+)